MSPRLFFTPLVLLIACAAPDNPDARRSYLFGADESDIVDVAATYDVDPDALALQLAAPFDCDRHAALCFAVGTEAAEEILGDAWALALDGVPVAEIEAQTMAAISASDAVWSPDAEFRSWTPPDGITSYSDGITDFRVRVRASQYTLLFTRYHKVQLWHEAQAPNDTWHGSDEDLFVELEATRLYGGNSTIKTCDDSKFGSEVSCYRTMSTGGTQTTIVSATVNGHTAVDTMD